MNETISYLGTFVSLILGLAVANLLANYAALVKRRQAVRWYWIHTAWVGFLLVLLASEWWLLQLWGEPDYRISYFIYLSFLIKPCLLFFISDLLFPERDDLDLRAHFHTVRRTYFLVFALYGPADLLDTLLKGWDHFASLGPAYPVLVATQVIGSVAAAYIASERFQVIIVIASYVGLAASIVNALHTVS